MIYKKIILICLLSASLYASDEEVGDLFDYSCIGVNDSVSVYAGRVYMQNFKNEYAYSVGLLLHDDKRSKTDYGVGYMQPSDEIDSLLISSPDAIDPKKEEGMLFFMNYHF